MLLILDNLKKILEKASFFGVENISQSEKQELLKAKLALQKLEEVIQKEKLGKLARMVHHHHPF